MTKTRVVPLSHRFGRLHVTSFGVHVDARLCFHRGPCLTVGIGAAIAVFIVFNALVFGPQPPAYSEQLVRSPSIYRDNSSTPIFYSMFAGSSAFSIADSNVATTLSQVEKGVGTVSAPRIGAREREASIDDGDGDLANGALNKSSKYANSVANTEIDFLLSRRSCEPDVQSCGLGTRGEKDEQA
jgi:hypothetical protein